MIYFIRCTATGLIKIGFSASPWVRLSKMQTDSPGELTMLALLEGDQKGEAALHARFAADRVRGEWFRASDAVCAMVRENLQPFRVKRGPSLLTRMIVECGVAKGYASEILSGKRTPSLELAVRIFGAIGWRAPLIAEATDAELAVLKRFCAPHKNSRRLAA